MYQSAMTSRQGKNSVTLVALVELSGHQNIRHGGQHGKSRQKSVLDTSHRTVLH